MSDQRIVTIKGAPPFARILWVIGGMLVALSIRMVYAHDLPFTSPLLWATGCGAVVAMTLAVGLWHRAGTVQFSAHAGGVQIRQNGALIAWSDIEYIALVRPPFSSKLRPPRIELGRSYSGNSTQNRPAPVRLDLDRAIPDTAQFWVDLQVIAQDAGKALVPRAHGSDTLWFVQGSGTT